LLPFCVSVYPICNFSRMRFDSAERSIRTTGEKARARNA
jgi:hypothetical protein